MCPRCGKMLVLRNGKNGQFYGCSGYPNCRFTKNI
ncbi:MAG: topoisomerase DNA-binding C4 zinc finger domain-containing protein [Methanomassiliicoccaceae archaeon]|nr:topoisomerase DNA-binding C4 zinc finger domain-containing protein [Methanomassiliicoccaceae archaeon]